MNVLHVLAPVTLSAMTIFGAFTPVPRPPDGSGAKRGPQIAPTTADTVDTAKNDTFTPPLLGPTLRYGMDTTVSPCVDFFQYVNGGWRAQTKFKNGFVLMSDDAFARTEVRLQRILDSAWTVRTTTKDPTLKVVGMFYESCLTADTLERRMTRSPSKPKTPPKPPDRKKECLSRMIEHMGGVLGQAFVQDLITGPMKDRMEQLLAAIRVAVIERIKANPLLNETEKARMLKSMEKLTLRVGIPKDLVDYTSLVLTADYYENKKAIANFESFRQTSFIGANARDQFKNRLLTANAFYDASSHSVEVLPVLFMPPYFDVTAEDALNFGGVGRTIGHEIFHSLTGQLKTVENPEMAKQIQRLKAFYSSLGVLDGWPTDGNRTYGEDVADLGGVLVAYSAWKATVKANKKKPAPLVDGFTPDQRFFIALGLSWRSKWSVSTAIPHDPHSAPFARVNGMVAQSPAFAKAFGCKPNDPMAPTSDRSVTIW